MSQTTVPQEAHPDQNPAEQPANAQQVAIPERPALAPNIELSGAMQESGFEKQQWLVQRDGRFIQLTELLYRVAEQANGERSAEEMAQGVSEATGRKVSPDNVRQLLGKLIPLGIVLQDDGTVAASASAGDATRSPLSVNMKMMRVPARFIDPFTAVLQWLYHPVVLIAVLIVCAAAQVWLFFVHGIAGGLRDLLYRPGLLLAVLAIIVVATAWHEFGHAAALRYGGGQVRGMGAGIYLIYPAFYTDVTDNYRLGRWARVRTDLGGFYFNLIFCAALIALYLITGIEFLLLIVLFVDLEIIHQCLPFVRLDGYWALADITGIPDFFSQIGPFLRTVLPLPFWKGPQLPELKGWVKAVFALYILITIPVLIFLLFMLIKSVPHVLATGWDSFQQQREAFGKSRSEGSLSGMAAALAQMLLLALPTLGTLYILYMLGQKIVRGLWSWGGTSPARRATSVAAMATLAGILAFLWAPQLPGLPGRDGQPARGALLAYTQANFSPIPPEARGAIPEALPVPIVAPEASPRPTATVQPSVTTVPSGTVVPTGTVAPTGTAAPTTTVAPTGTTAPTTTVAPTGTTAPNVPVVPTAVPLVPTAVPQVPPAPSLPPASALPSIVPTVTPPPVVPTALPSTNPVPTVAPGGLPVVGPTPTARP